MPTVAKTTSDIHFGSWTTIQMRATLGNQLTDLAPLDDLGGPGPNLAFENGIWKYPQQDDCGRVEIPSDLGFPLRLVTVMADFGAITDWTLHIAGIDGTAQRPNNLSNTPYPSADAALYQEKNIVIASGNDRYLAINVDPVDAGTAALIHPGMHVYATTSVVPVVGIEPLIRYTFSKAFEKMG
jgi:hypothetical protein